MNNGENNNNQNNIVKPQNVDLNKVQVNNDDTLLNRERSNIVSATIQANNSIDKTQATLVNNEIKTEKHHNYMFAVVIVTIIVLCTVAGVVIYKLMSGAVDYVNQDETTTKTTTTTSLADRFNGYLRNYTKVRKFVSDNYILILTSEGCDIVNNKEHYLLINTSKDGIISSKNGTYTIENDKVKLDQEVLEYDQDGIKYNNEVLKIYDSEMKYYQYKDNDNAYLLILNATMRNEIAFFIASNKKDIEIKTDTFKETESSITLGEDQVFAKAEDNITYNNYTLTRAS